MEKISSLSEVSVFENSESKPMIVDTSFVLFFMAIDIGQSLTRFGFDTAIMGIALVLVAVFPYFVTDQRSSLRDWLTGRGIIVGFAVMLGLIFNQSVGVVFPQTMNMLPFALVILTAMLSCYIQFHNFFKFRLSN